MVQDLFEKLKADYATADSCNSVQGEQIMSYRLNTAVSAHNRKSAISGAGHVETPAVPEGTNKSSSVL
ncbi:unnamed protein product [Angiostrongylus costaricensis]|uniref:Transposase n=1 Tax=Angiostrongylus costaricensis TaxID=334426 RepID=A0A0R3PLH6_ANGCS|nr:unnamed protein product [Angiostrongylus costaricensis]